MFLETFKTIIHRGRVYILKEVINHIEVLKANTLNINQNTNKKNKAIKVRKLHKQNGNLDKPEIIDFN